MSERKWTKGPWVVGGIDHDDCRMKESFVGTSDGYVVGCAYEISQSCPHEREANAFLIAAAPDLYEALYDLVNQFETFEAGLIHSERVAVAKARAALQRAEGKKREHGRMEMVRNGCSLHLCW